MILIGCAYTFLALRPTLKVGGQNRGRYTYEYVLAKVTLTNDSDETLHYLDRNFNFSIDDVKSDHRFMILSAKGYEQLGYGSVEPGGTKSAYVIDQVPENSKLKLIYVGSLEGPMGEQHITEFELR